MAFKAPDPWSTSPERDADKMFCKQTLIDLYRKRSRRYAFTANVYYLIGVRDDAYRKRAVARTSLQTGHMVLEISCGQDSTSPRGAAEFSRPSP